MIFGWMQFLIAMVIVLIIVLIFKVSKISDAVEKIAETKSDIPEVDDKNYSTSDCHTIGLSNEKWRQSEYENFWLPGTKVTSIRKGQKIEISYDDYIKLLNELYDEPIDINGLTLDNTNQLILQRVRQLKRIEDIRYSNKKRKGFFREVI